MKKFLTVVRDVIMTPITFVYTAPAVILVFGILDQMVMSNFPMKYRIRQTWEDMMNLLMDSTEDHWGDIAWHALCVSSAALFYTLGYLLIKKFFFS